MSDPHNDNHHPLSVDTVDHAIVADSNPKVIRLRFELLAARWKRIVAERYNFLGDAPLKLPVEVAELPGGRCREFENVAHMRDKRLQA